MNFIDGQSFHAFTVWTSWRWGPVLAVTYPVDAPWCYTVDFGVVSIVTSEATSLVDCLTPDVQNGFDKTHRRCSSSIKWRRRVLSLVLICRRNRNGNFYRIANKPLHLNGRCRRLPFCYLYLHNNKYDNHFDWLMIKSFSNNQSQRLVTDRCSYCRVCFFTCSCLSGVRIPTAWWQSTVAS